MTVDDDTYLRHHVIQTGVYISMYVLICVVSSYMRESGLGGLVEQAGQAIA
jgi:hypothetical protein